MRPPDPDSGPLRRGAKLGPYTLIELIGAGGMGSVSKAEGTRLNGVVAAPTAQRSAPPAITVVLDWPDLVSK